MAKTKKIKPGQIYVHNGSFLRAKKRVEGCNGCILNNPFLCPNLALKGKEENGPNCEDDNIIFVRFT